MRYARALAFGAAVALLAATAWSQTGPTDSPRGVLGEGPGTQAPAAVDPALKAPTVTPLPPFPPGMPPPAPTQEVPPPAPAPEPSPVAQPETPAPSAAPEAAAAPATEPTPPAPEPAATATEPAAVPAAPAEPVPPAETPAAAAPQPAEPAQAAPAPAAVAQPEVPAPQPAPPAPAPAAAPAAVPAPAAAAPAVPPEVAPKPVRPAPAPAAVPATPAGPPAAVPAAAPRPVPPAAVPAAVPAVPPGQPGAGAAAVPGAAAPAATPPAPSFPRPRRSAGVQPGGPEAPGAVPGTPGVAAPGTPGAVPPGVPGRPPVARGQGGGPLKVAMNFKDAELEAVVKFISELMGLNFILDDKVKGKVTVISPTQLTVEEAYEVFQAILVVKGFTIVPAGKVYKIVATREAKQGNIETVTEKVPPGDRFVTRIMPLKRVPVENLTPILTPLVSKDGSLVPYSPTNTLIITDSYSNIERLGEIVQALDVDTVDTLLEIIPIRYASADTISKSLVQIMTEKNKGQKKRPSVGGAPGAPPGAAAAAAAGGDTGPKIIPDVRTNSLIVIADPGTMEDIKTIIRALDVEIPKGTGKINVYYLRYADAENVASVLTAISKNAGPKGKPGQPGQPGQPAAAAPKATGEISIELEEAVQITADKATNSLVIIATPQDFELLKTVIAKLDIRRPQVLVETVIMEMNYDKSLDLGVEWRIADSNPTSGGTKIIGGSGFGSIASAMANPLGLSGGLVLAAVDGTITYGSQTFANISAMVTALQKTGDINVLSTPHLLTTNNEEAEIIVSDNIPFQTSQKFDNNGNPIYTFDYKDVGLTLRLTPQINDDAWVKLKVFQEVSQLLSTTTGTNSNAPSTSKRQAKTTIVVKDGATVVIGGLVKDNTLKNISAVPCLGDIPILGYFFRHSTVQKQKVNLLIFLTPHVIYNTEDIEKISEQKRQEYEVDTKSPSGGAEGAAEKMHKYLNRGKEGPKP